MSRHTKGPWHKRTVLLNGTDWAHQIEQPDHMPHATVFDRAGHGADTPEAAANARLIASAPELLASLRIITDISQRINDIQHAGQTVYPDTWADLYQATNSAKAAIARATSQSVE